MAHDDMSQDGTGRDDEGREEAGDAAQGEASAETAAPRGPRAGARLKEAREARNISLDEMARELHLDLDKLRDLEANRFDSFSAPVFTKGYLRRYAGLVGVGESEVLADFEELSDAAGPPPVVVKPPPARPRYVPSLRAVLLVLLAVLLGGLGWWAFSGAVLKPVQEAGNDGSPVLPQQGETRPALTVAGEAPRVSSSVAPSTAPSVAEAGAVEESEGVGSGAAATPAEPENESVVENTDAAALAAPPASADAAGEIELTLSFSDECWLQVTDGNGERLYAGIARGGQVRRFTAEPPVSVVLGNADAVSIEVDGEPYPIDAADRRGRTARITVSGS